ncbi:unnamed protein product [Dibothriocephalus latus]|uniref:Tetraspanin n=1 Tax=Dibothriocephalus latus TaxID=60516 RepID=A0A3P7NL23_DIBLA|nr:unnamed protein product [Dibothriocephalus latus]
MALSCGTKCIKYLLFIFNALVFLFGAVITGFGIYFVVEATKNIGGQAVGIPAFILTLGLLVFIIGFLGCCGACKEHVCMLKTFVTVMADGIADQIKHLNTLPPEERKETRKALDELQEKLKCCGGHSAADWKNVPASCCKNGKANCPDPYPQGCAKAMYEEIKNKALAVGIVIFVMAIIQLGAIISACCLAKKIGEYEKV